MQKLPPALRKASQLPLGPVLVLGDVMLDIYISGTVSRISPEAPVPVMLRSKEDARAGAAANVALNIAAIGGDVALIGVTGQDEHAQQLTNLAEEQGVVCDLIHLPQYRTITKTRIVSEQHHQFLRIDQEEPFPTSPQVTKQIFDKLEHRLQHTKALVLSDYGKGALSDDVLKGAISRAKAAGVPVFVDPKRPDFAAYAQATVIKPNLKELGAAIGRTCTDEDDIIAACRSLSRETGSSILLTMSDRGMTFVNAEDDEAIRVPAIAKEVFDVSGAGDTVIALFAALSAGGVSVPDALHIANVAAGIVVSKAGTAALRMSELTDKLHRDDVASHGKEARGVFPDWDTLAKQRQTWADQGLKVGFTNGCFDLLHPGHVQLLREAAAQCDRLVIGLNTDASVKRLKGDARPIQSENARAQVMSALSFVDAVVLFDQDTPLDLISLLLPDVLVKGADYAEDQIVGGDVVKENGGSIFRAELVEGQSTSRLVQRSSQGE